MPDSPPDPRNLKRKNLTLLVILLALMVLIYAISLMRMQSGG